MLLKSILLLNLAGVCLATIGDLQFGTQSYAVKGRLLCGGVPADRIKVKLVDEDFGGVCKQNCME